MDEEKKHVFPCVYKRYLVLRLALIWPHVVVLGRRQAWLAACLLAGTGTSACVAVVNPFRTAVPLWGQTTQISSSLSPNGDCCKGVKRNEIPTAAVMYRRDWLTSSTRKWLAHPVGSWLVSGISSILLIDKQSYKPHVSQSEPMNQ